MNLSGLAAARDSAIRVFVESLTSMPAHERATILEMLCIKTGVARKTNNHARRPSGPHNGCRTGRVLTSVDKLSALKCHLQA